VENYERLSKTRGTLTKLERMGHKNDRSKRIGNRIFTGTEGYFSGSERMKGKILVEKQIDMRKRGRQVPDIINQANHRVKS
jgi:hypothetical protein